MNILGIDTSTRSASVAIMRDGVILCENTINDRRTHSQKFMPILESIFNAVDMDVSDIDIIAVCVGPGSFTGIRIGVSTAKAFSHIYDIPVVAVNSLEAVAMNVNYLEKNIVSIIDAQSRNLYCAEFHFDEGNRSVDILSVDCDIKIISIDELVEKYKSHTEKILFVGDGVEKHRDIIEKEGFLAVDDVYNIPRASNICRIAIQKYVQKKDVYNCYSIKPVYVKKSQAEIQLEQKDKKVDSDVL